MHRLNLERFGGVNKVHLLGRQPPEILPSHLKGMDVCLNLFKRTPLTRAVNPLKVYEYLAAGKPVISTPMREVDKFGELVLISQDAESFISAVERALSWSDDSEQIKGRMQVVASYSWERIFDEVMTRMIELQNRVPDRSSCGGTRGA